MSSQNPDSFGKIRVLVAGNSGSGKTSVSHLIATGRKPRGDVAPTVGCQVHVRLYEFEEPSGARHKYFVELWDVGAHRRYEPLRKTFYGKINGVILVHDIAGGGAPAALQRWAMEIADQGTFSAELAPEAAADNLGALPVPVLVLYNKADKLQRTAAPAGVRPGPAARRCRPPGQRIAGRHRRGCGGLLLLGSREAALPQREATGHLCPARDATDPSPEASHGAPALQLQPRLGRF
uniref:Rab-like protein 3 n=1 Tax=Tetraselmis sp. GSL018 TaxID=582737 RepID=A0A061SBQ5_9CHLO